jgi:hypothetical protein
MYLLPSCHVCHPSYSGHDVQRHAVHLLHTPNHDDLGTRDLYTSMQMTNEFGALITGRDERARRPAVHSEVKDAIRLYILQYSTEAREFSPHLLSGRTGGSKHGLCLAQLRILFQLRVPIGGFLIIPDIPHINDRKRNSRRHAPGGPRVLPQLSPAVSRCPRPFFRSRVLDSPAGKSMDMDRLSKECWGEGGRKREGMVVVFTFASHAPHFSRPMTTLLLPR